ncbi:RNA-dependent RNA polymerase [viral metagenome]|uniref:RNA-dependent RNA polymerase n=1 Tax=viral metagenome TaxID=1070528 RepID=A0A6L2ZL51_9ZZZZ
MAEPLHAFAPAEWLRENTDLPDINTYVQLKGYKRQKSNTPHWDQFRLWALKMLKAPRGVGRPEKFNLYILHKVHPGWDNCLQQLMMVNSDASVEEFSVAGIGLWYVGVRDSTKDWVANTGVFGLRLAEWNSRLKTFFDTVRQYGRVGGTQHSKEVATDLRKVTSIIGRKLDEADWNDEWDSINRKVRTKTAGNHPDTMSSAKWMRMFKQECDIMAEEVISQVANTGHMQGMREWWEQRVMWAPTGSSSNRHRLDSEIKSLGAMGMHERPNKKAVWNTIKWEDVVEKLKELPPSVARLSTKPEPGGKQRALYASDDWSTIFASYASQDVEKMMAIGGMVARQTPSDVVKWLKNNSIDGRNEEACWVSLDYKDFNKEHSKLMLAWLNISLSRAWSRRRNNTGVMAQKAWMALVVAYQHMNAFVQWKHLSSAQRVFFGLWSGHRDTARDNTMLHCVYHRIALRQALIFGLRVERPIYIGMCGDDEDSKFRSWREAIAYVGVHMMMGHELNPKKQQFGYQYHEFLQRQSDGPGLPMRPLAPVLATLATGNWYKEPGHWFDAAVQAMTSNCWEAVARGYDHLCAARLATVMLDNHMRVKTRNGTTLYEWECYKGSTANNALWNEPIGAKVEKFSSQVRLPKLRNHGIVDIMTSRSKWIKHMSEGDRVRYMTKLEQEVNRSLVSREAEKLRTQEAQQKLENRKTPHTKLPSEEMITRVAPPNEECLVREFLVDRGKRRPMPLESKLQRIKMDIDIFNALGGWLGVAKYGKPSDIQHLDTSLEQETTKLSNSELLLDGALQNWLRETR